MVIVFLAVATMAELRRYKVEEHLTCSVCLEPFKDPKVLPCLHSYCHVCIVKTGQECKFQYYQLSRVSISSRGEENE